MALSGNASSSDRQLADDIYADVGVRRIENGDANVGTGEASGALIGNIWSLRMEKQKRIMQQAAQGTGIQVIQTGDNHLKLDIPSKISFDVNRADIRPAFLPVLDRFADTLADNPATVVNIVGHADESSGSVSDSPLSIERAVHSRDYLVRRGIAPARTLIAQAEGDALLALKVSTTRRVSGLGVEIYVAENSR
ncbi:MAG: OmpA family protein [Herminiimonas sp.]|nr:OmpA family protein [Herminiimonas sp.]